MEKGNVFPCNSYFVWNEIQQRNHNCLYNVSGSDNYSTSVVFEILYMQVINYSYCTELATQTFPIILLVLAGKFLLHSDFINRGCGSVIPCFGIN